MTKGFHLTDLDLSFPDSLSYFTFHNLFTKTYFINTISLKNFFYIHYILMKLLYYIHKTNKKHFIAHDHTLGRFPFLFTFPTFSLEFSFLNEQFPLVRPLLRFPVILFFFLFCLAKYAFHFSTLIPFTSVYLRLCLLSSFFDAVIVPRRLFIPALQ